MNEERIKQLNTMDEIAFRELQAENKRLKKRVQEAEGEVTIIKGIGNNSPEMKELQARIKELDNSLSIALEVNDKHQRYNGKLQTRLTQIEDKLNQLRKSGM